MCKFEKLEGKEVRWTYENEDLTAIVIGCDPEVGLTLIDKNNKKRELTCLVAPGINEYDQHKFKEMFDATVIMINEGHYKGEVTDKIFDDGMPRGFGYMAICAFK